MLHSIRQRIRRSFGQIWTLTHRWWIVYRYSVVSVLQPMETVLSVVRCRWQRAHQVENQALRWVVHTVHTIRITLVWSFLQVCSSIILSSMEPITRPQQTDMFTEQVGVRVLTMVDLHGWAITSASAIRTSATSRRLVRHGMVSLRVAMTWVWWMVHTVLRQVSWPIKTCTKEV